MIATPIPANAASRGTPASAANPARKIPNQNDVRTSRPRHGSRHHERSSLPTTAPSGVAGSTPQGRRLPAGRRRRRAVRFPVCGVSSRTAAATASAVASTSRPRNPSAVPSSPAAAASTARTGQPDGNHPSTAVTAPAPRPRKPSRRKGGPRSISGHTTTHPANSVATSSPYWIAAISTPTCDRIAAPISAYTVRDSATVNTTSSAAPTSPTATAAATRGPLPTVAAYPTSASIPAVVTAAPTPTNTDASNPAPSRLRSSGSSAKYSGRNTEAPEVRIGPTTQPTSHTARRSSSTSARAPAAASSVPAQVPAAAATPSTSPSSRFHPSVCRWIANRSLISSPTTPAPPARSPAPPSAARRRPPATLAP